MIGKIGIYGVALAVQHALPGFEDTVPTIYFCRSGVTLIVCGKHVGVIVYGR